MQPLPRVPGPVTALVALALALSIAPRGSHAGDTFSIVAVDPVTQQVGSAGASCISGSIIISDVHPGTGAVHTQSYWNGANQAYAHALMDQGYAPQAIIDSLVANDAQNNPGIRQYGVVDLVGGGRSAAFTGNNCIDYKGHITAPRYSIQGNILLGPEILEQMESGFLGTLGSLADKLMAALQGAKVPGADTRCLQYGKSSISAFIRVAKPGDPDNDLYLDLNVNNTPASQDPIDILQALYDDWRLQATGVGEGGPSVGRGDGTYLRSEPNPFCSTTVLRYRVAEAGRTVLRIADPAGRVVAVLVDQEQAAGFHAVGWEPDRDLPTGVYFCTLATGRSVATGRLIHLKSGR